MPAAIIAPKMKSEDATSPQDQLDMETGSRRFPKKKLDREAGKDGQKPRQQVFGV